MTKSMNIGLVYDLREEYLALGYSELDTNEFGNAADIDEIVWCLERLGHSVDRIGNGRALAARLVSGHSWDLIFPVAEGLRGRNREAQVPALLELFDQPYVFSDALTMSVTLDKDVAKRLVRGAGIPTPKSMLFETEIVDVGPWETYPAFVKPVAEGTSNTPPR